MEEDCSVPFSCTPGREGGREGGGRERRRFDGMGRLEEVVEEKVLLYVHRNRRFIRDGSPGRPPRLSHSSRALEEGGRIEGSL